MRHALAAALLALTAAPALAGAPTTTFSRDGQTYSYTASRAADDMIVVRGNNVSTGDTFVLRIAGSRVSGRMGAAPVSFVVSPETVARLAAEMPAQQASVQTALVSAN